MPAFSSPLSAPAGWTYTLPGSLTVPVGLRYAGDRLVQLRADHPGAGGVLRMPALGVLRSVTPNTGPLAGRVVVEVQPNPFPVRRVAQAVPFGLPTFYLVLDAGLASPVMADGDTAAAGDALATVTGVSILCAGQDRLVRDPALWSAQILAALGTAGGTTTDWEPFATAVGQRAAGTAAPVLLLDHAGRPRLGGSVEITAGTTTATAVLTAADDGDLQRAVARMHAANPATMPLADVFDGFATATVRPAAPGGGDVQLARVEDGLTGAGSLAVTPAQRHVTFTDLHDWFAPQSVAASPLARYSRGNAFTPLVNGPEYFDDLFRRLQDARAAGAQGGLHLTGWSMFPEEELTRRLAGDPADLPVTLKDAATLIAAAGGSTRFLPAQFFQLDPTTPITPAEILAIDLIVTGLLMARNVGAVRSDVAGTIILAGITIANAIAITYVIDNGGRPIEPNKSAVDLLGAIANARSEFSPFPAALADNPLSPPLTHFPWTTLFTVIRNVGIYHQKLAIVRAGTDRIGYCGGIDLNPDRLDDIRHLAKAPYHDVHSRVRGPAVRDLELSFTERWTRDGAGAAPAFAPGTTVELGTPGTDVVQVARTYFAAAAAARALPFASAGDRTIADTMLAAIHAATDFIYIEDQYFTPPLEYRTALLAKVTNREIRSLVVTMPGIADQPFGEIIRSGFISDLQIADAGGGGGIVRIGYPRRHYTVPDNQLRASSGRLRLMAPLAAAGGLEPSVWLGPKARIPDVPFWLSVDGELMYVYDEAIGVTPPEDRRGFQVARGAETRLVMGGPVATAQGSRVRGHAVGAAATVVDLAGIYVHAKMMIVDDVFLGLGSANLNRRGLFHDGEINVFTVPEALRATRPNPVTALRTRLWAEMFDLPVSTVGPLLEDPHAAARLFDRSPLLGNRWTDIQAFPTHLMYDATSGDGIVGLVLGDLIFTALAIDHAKLYDGVVDPTSSLGS